MIESLRSEAVTREGPVWVYSVEKLPRPIKPENAEALESLEFERAEGPATSDDISPQLIVAPHGARLSLVFSHNLIYV